MKLLFIFIYTRLCVADDGVDVFLELSDYLKSCKRFEHMDFETLYYSYIPYANNHIIKVSDENNITIWEREPEEGWCVNVIAYMKNGESKLILLNISDHFGNYYRHFERTVNNLWNELDPMEYSSRLYKLLYQREIDINDVSNNSFISSFKTPFGNSVHLLDPLQRILIAKITDSGNVIWEPRNDYENCIRILMHSRRGVYKLVNLMLFNDIIMEAIYYEKRNGEWILITENEYNEKVRQIEYECTLDVSGDNDDDLFTVTRNATEGALSLIYTPEFYVNNSEVKDGNIVIWKSDDWKCAFCTVYLKNGESVLTKIHIENAESHGDLYFEKKVEEWVEVGNTEFYETLDKLDSDVEVEALTSNITDLQLKDDGYN